MDKLQTYLKKNKEVLDLYSHAITKAHGDNHPEVFEVRAIYLKIQEKAGEENLDSEFKHLREITDDYKIPNDVCQTFEKTYCLLEEADTIYKVEK
jgi:iron-sulfur cluster repair protein YtfE (RIC family)